MHLGQRVSYLGSCVRKAQSRSVARKVCEIKLATDSTQIPQRNKPIKPIKPIKPVDLLFQSTQHCIMPWNWFSVLHFVFCTLYYVLLFEIVKAHPAPWKGTVHTFGAFLPDASYSADVEVLCIVFTFIFSIDAQQVVSYNQCDRH
jgi:hypothetical protein